VVEGGEEAELAPLAALNDDDGVQEVLDLGQIENVLNLSHAGLFVVKSMTEEGVVVCDEVGICAEGHVRAQHDMHRVVEKSDDENGFLGAATDCFSAVLDSSGPYTTCANQQTKA
jgi:hypothetical protein